MSDDERAQIFVTVADERLELILPGHGWTFDEAKIAKEVSEGMSPVAIEQSLMDGDPDAWLAVLRVSYERANKDWPARKIAEQDVLALVKATTKAVREATKNRPPTSRNGSESPEPAETSEPEPTEVPS